MQRNIFITVVLLFITMKSGFANPIDLPNVYSNPYNHYSIHYPENWHFYDRGRGVVIFKTRFNDGSFQLIVNLQTIYTKKAGGNYATVKNLMDDFYTQVPMHTRAATFLERKPFILQVDKQNPLQGEQTLFTFHENGQVYKQWQIMLMSQDGKVFQNWAYRAPLKYFAIYQPIAAAQVASWKIN